MHERVCQLLRSLYLDKRTGVLLSEVGDDKRSLFFRSGLVVGARSSLEHERLGEVVIRHGRITRQQLEDASHFIKSGKKMGDILVELGNIDRGELDGFLRIQVMDIACPMLFEPRQRLKFSNLSQVEDVLSKPLFVGAIVMEAARRTTDIEKHAKDLLEDARHLHLAPDPITRFQDVSLSPEEAFILSRIDGTESPRDVFLVSPLPEEQTARTVLGLCHAGIVVPEEEAARQKQEMGVDEPPQAPDDLTKTHSREDAMPGEGIRKEVEHLFEESQTSDHWQVLGIERGSSSEEVARAFREKARRYHPDRYRSISDVDFQKKLSGLFVRLGEAFQTLSTSAATECSQPSATDEPLSEAFPTPPLEPSPPRRDPEEAKSLFAQAKRACQEQDYWQTIQLCQQAIDIVADRGEYYHLLGLAQAQNSKWRLDAERNLKIAAKLDPWKPEYFVALGELYQKAGMRLKAQRMFEQAKSLDAD